MMCEKLETQNIKSDRQMLNLQADIHELAKDKGWWKEERRFGEIIALIHSELSEALESYRNHESPIYYKDKDDKPHGWGIELADCVIRIMDFCERSKIDLEAFIKIKHDYNQNRPYRHGGKRI